MHLVIYRLTNNILFNSVAKTCYTDLLYRETLNGSPRQVISLWKIQVGLLLNLLYHQSQFTRAAKYKLKAAEKSLHGESPSGKLYNYTIIQPSTKNNKNCGQK